MISHRFRCIYVHIPKTAGNSVNRIFGIDWESHKDLARYAREWDPAALASYFKFAIVRNPWDRMLSDYDFQKKKRRDKKTKLHLYGPNGAMRSFKEWVDAVLSNPFEYPPDAWGAEVSEGLHRWSPQVEWISLHGRIAVDEVLRLEQLDEDFRRVRDFVGLPKVELPRRNSKSHWHYSHYYDDYTRDRVAQYYTEDIQRFGYQFETRGCSLIKHLLRVFVR